MKKPYLKYEQRLFCYNPKLEIAKLKLKREFEKSNFGLLIKKITKKLEMFLEKVK